MILENPQELIFASYALSSKLKTRATKVSKQERISFNEGVYLYNHANSSYLGTSGNISEEEKIIKIPVRIPIDFFLWLVIVLS